MLVALRLPLTFALIALSVLLASARAEAISPTPVLWGGVVTTDGTGHGTYNSVGDRFKSKDDFSLHFHTERVVPDLYPVGAGGVGLLDDGGTGHVATKWDQNVGTGSGWWQSSHLDDDDNVVWDTPVSCSITGKQIDPGQLSVPDEDESPRVMSTHPLTRIVDFPATCTNGDTSAGAFAGSDLTWAVNGAAEFDLGGRTAPQRSTWTQPFGLSERKDCGGSSSTCAESYSAEGTTTITCALCVTDMRLEHRDQSNGGALIDVPAEGTTDGNRVWVTAKVVNKTNYTYKAIVGWRERTSKRVLMSVGSPAQITTFPANATTTVVLELDTSGFAYEKGAPRKDREIELITPLGGGFVKLKVLPKPVVMVHGWKADASGWDTAKGLIAAVHPDLPDRSFAVGDGKAYGIMDTSPTDGRSIGENAQQEADYIAGIRSKLDAEHVDLLVHSMGGLISRAYINSYMPESKDFLPVVSHLLMFGTPNMGSPCADLMAPALRGLPTQQLRPAFVDGIFNKSVINTRRVPFAILAGDYMPTTCGSSKEGDGVVEVESAYWTIADRTRGQMHHIGLTDVPEYYSGWVKHRIGLDPDQACNLGQWDPSKLPGGCLTEGGGGELAAREARAPAAPAAAEALDVAAAETVTVPAGGSADVALDVRDGTALVAAHDAPAGVAAKLIAPSGASVEVVAAGSDAARQPVRGHRVASPMGGVWKLRLSQVGGSARAVHVSLGLAGSALKLTASGELPATGGTAVLTATLRDGGAAVPGAKVVAELRSAQHGTRTVELAGSGDTFTAEVADLPADDWFAVVTATAGDRTRIAAATVGAAPAGGPGGGGEGDGGGDGDGGDEPGPGPSTDPGGSANPGPSAPSDGGRTTTTPNGAPPRAASSGARLAPRGVTLSAKAKRDRRKPYAFALSGRVTLPAAAPAKACAGGRVALQLALGQRVVATKQVALSADCRFRATITTKKRGRLTAAARFLGTPALAPVAMAGKGLALRAG